MDLKRHRKFISIISLCSLLIFILFFILLFTFSKNNSSAKIEIVDKVEWTLGEAEDSLEEAASYKYSSFDIYKRRNLKALVGKEGQFVWLRINFEIPENLQNQDLGLLIPYLHFADKVWINGCFSGQYGSFPPEERSSLFSTHFYSLPQKNLIQDGVNTILIKVWCKGGSDISSKLYISDYKSTYENSVSYNYNHSLIYLAFEGALFCVFLIFFLTFLGRREDGSLMTFALMNLSAIVFSMVLFNPLVPIYNSSFISFLAAYKICMCFSFFCVIYFMTSFIVRFIKNKETNLTITFRMGVLTIPSVMVFFARDYNSLQKMCPACLCIISLQFFYLVAALFRGFFSGNSERKLLCKRAIGLFSPVLLGVIVDFFLRRGTYDLNIPYATFLGFIGEIIVFITVYTIQFNASYKENKYLNENLQKEIDKKTEDLRISNKLLSEQLKKSEDDLNMAAIVQQKFFPYRNKGFIGWDTAVIYKPLETVSGDLYDYFSIGSYLDGVALFDVSGHEIASSLITMLSKNIILDCFKKSRFYDYKASQIMYDINNKITEAKGGVLNYLTGLILKISTFDDKDNCKINFSSAGHPNPVFYDSEKGKCSPVDKNSATGEQKGAIGMPGVKSSFADYNLELKKDDILFCFSDGITETKNSEGSIFGKERVSAIIEQNHEKSAKEILEVLMKNLQDFAGEVKFDDDITAILLKREASGDYLEELETDVL